MYAAHPAPVPGALRVGAAGAAARASPRRSSPAASCSCRPRASPGFALRALRLARAARGPARARLPQSRGARRPAPDAEPGRGPRAPARAAPSSRPARARGRPGGRVGRRSTRRCAATRTGCRRTTGDGVGGERPAVHAGAITVGRSTLWRTRSRRRRPVLALRQTTEPDPQRVHRCGYDLRPGSAAARSRGVVGGCRFAQPLAAPRAQRLARVHDVQPRVVAGEQERRPPRAPRRARRAGGRQIAATAAPWCLRR